MKKQSKGITLVGLIITAIILLILAGISIASLTNIRLFSKTQKAKQEQENAQIKENAIVANYENKIDEYLNGTRNILNLDSFKNYKEIYTSGMIADNKSVDYTLDKSYPLVVAVVSGVGSASGVDAIRSNISTNNNSQGLIKLIDNECAPYSSGKYYSTLTMAYMVNPTVGTTFTCSINFRGTIHIYAIGD